ncbi:hypothetical protein GCM10010274_63040 [Streptomyces lavendofoliae]|uniref:Uncharacterized protein n=1 Tax=Streptomyces lavendofoliae TaxID=67314 RepID=A0A918I581_9ACTN|nr:hypothetical protein GCM10010274_63040 [Streptomyces lavendofoliae]
MHDFDGDDCVDDGPQVRDEALAVRAGLELLLSGWCGLEGMPPLWGRSCGTGHKEPAGLWS